MGCILYHFLSKTIYVSHDMKIHDHRWCYLQAPLQHTINVEEVHWTESPTPLSQWMQLRKKYIKGGCVYTRNAINFNTHCVCIYKCWCYMKENFEKVWRGDTTKLQQRIQYIPREEALPRITMPCQTPFLQDQCCHNQPLFVHIHHTTKHPTMNKIQTKKSKKIRIW